GADAPEQAAGPAERAASVQDTLAIEGMREPVTLRLYTPPAGFPLPFSTYVPEDMRAETVSSGEGDGVRFVAHFGGVPNEHALVHLFVYPVDALPEHARETVRAIAESYGPVREFGEIEPADRFGWAAEQYRISGRGPGSETMIGDVGLGERNGRWFHIVVQHPAEFSDGFAPRAQRILDEWRWQGEVPLGRR
ncbi:MAG: hypothetical protein M3409_07980, partial [Gemmatimonadota bacterium]|nr:hypothetical protein [Gemmatimonadota bacterium]